MKLIIGLGSGRIVVDNRDGSVTKIPYGKLGLNQNLHEFELSKNKAYVATSYLQGDFIVQEKLTDLITVPYEIKDIDEIKKYLKQYDDEFDFTSLINHRLNSRIQIGKDKNGIYKYFDYEEVKHNENCDRLSR